MSSIKTKLELWRVYFSLIILIPLFLFHILITEYTDNLFHIYLFFVSLCHIIGGWHFHKSLFKKGASFAIAVLINLFYLLSFVFLFIENEYSNNIFHYSLICIACNNVVWTMGSIVLFKDNSWIVKRIKNTQKFSRDVKSGDELKIRKGEMIPCDGVIVSGKSNIDESIYEGFKDSIAKNPGDGLLAGTVNLTDDIIVKVTSDGNNGAIKRYNQMLVKILTSKCGFLSSLEKVENAIMLFIIIFICLYLAVWYLIYEFRYLDFVEDFWKFAIIAVLSILSIFHPLSWSQLAFHISVSSCAKNNVLAKGVGVLDKFKYIKYFLIDSDGLLIKKMKVCYFKLFKEEKYDLEKFWRFVILAEKQMDKTDKFAEAIINFAKEKSLFDEYYTHRSVDDGLDAVEKVSKKGIDCIFVDSNDFSSSVLIGSIDFIKSEARIEFSKSEKQVIEKQKKLNREIVLVSFGKDLIGIITLEKSENNIANFAERMKKRKCGINLISRTEKTEKLLQLKKKIFQPGTIDHCCGKLHVVPLQLKEVDKLHNLGHKVAVISQGNDPSYLDLHKKCDISITLNHDKENVLTDESDIILFNNNLDDLVLSYDLSKLSHYICSKNIKYGFLYNIISILFCCIFYLFIFQDGIPLNPTICILIRFLFEMFLMYQNTYIQTHSLSSNIAELKKIQ